MAEKEKKGSSLKKLFFRGKKEETLKQMTFSDLGGPEEKDFDFEFTEELKRAIGPPGPSAPLESSVKGEAKATTDKSERGSNHDAQRSFEIDGGEVVSQVQSVPHFVPAKKSVWSDETPAHDGAVISIDEINDLSGVVIPRSATFEVDELKIKAHTHVFDLKSKGGIPSQKESILHGEGIKNVTDAATAIEAGEPKSSLLKKLSPLSAIRREVPGYDSRIHGPLVNLTFRPRPGIEEIELYPVNEPYAYIRITYDHATHEYTYEILEPALTAAEEELFREIKERIFERLDINTQNIPDEEARTILRTVTDDVIADFGLSLSTTHREKILYNMYKEFLGNGKIDPIMHDQYIEDISCDGVNVNLFVYHTRYESMRTNLRYRNSTEIDSFVTKLAQRSGKYISIAEPMLDSTMHDGSRIQMTLGTEVTAHGSTYTIRKFKSEPITPTDLIEWSTFSPLSIAFLWLAVESGKSCIFAGGTASGKTTSLNAISLFIPPLAKIVTLEDTRELKLPHPNWIPSVTRTSFDAGGRGEIDMYELLRAALRQRPEYLIVGEVRGREALTLFQAMSTGHVTYSTIHADSVASIVHRLENSPMDVPRNMLSALDLVSVQVQVRIGGQRIRRTKQIMEILDLDPRTNELITNEVFRWHPVTDKITYSGKSFVLEEIMESRGWSEERMRDELKMRQEVLEWMRVKKIREYRDVSNILIQYYRDPTKIMEAVRADLYETG
jgi:flagellar protein FlaI